MKYFNFSLLFSVKLFIKPIMVLFLVFSIGFGWKLSGIISLLISNFVWLTSKSEISLFCAFSLLANTKSYFLMFL